MKIRNLALSFLALLILFFTSSLSISFAEEGKKEEKCDCDGPVVESLKKTYTSLEEDEWPVAIKACKDTLDKIKETKKTCKCKILDVYNDVGKAYLNYAEGGNILDGEGDIDCPKATKLYSEALELFKKATPQVLLEEVKKQVKTIWDYCKEEYDFVKEECPS